MKFLTRCLPEPDLEFGDGGRHLDPRYGLMTHGPLQPKPGDAVRIGVIGTSETVEGVQGFMERAMTGIPGINDRLGNLNPGFPGMGNQNPFRARFEIEPGATRTVLNKDVRDIQKIGKHPEAVKAAVDLFIDQARVLLEGSSRPEVIVLALPKPIIEKVVVRRQDIWLRWGRKLAESGPRLGVDVRRRACGAASADIRGSVA